ncbi:MAG TPA: hypothetical protein VIM63_00075 [Rhodoferax sp.]
MYAMLVVGVWQWMSHTGTPPASTALTRPGVSTPGDPGEAERCKVPDFAKALGHEAMWKLHNHCQ